MLGYFWCNAMEHGYFKCVVSVLLTTWWYCLWVWYSWCLLLPPPEWSNNFWKVFGFVTSCSSFSLLSILISTRQVYPQTNSHSLKLISESFSRAQHWWKSGKHLLLPFPLSSSLVTDLNRHCPALTGSHNREQIHCFLWNVPSMANLSHVKQTATDLPTQGVVPQHCYRVIKTCLKSVLNMEDSLELISELFFSLPCWHFSKIQYIHSGGERYKMNHAYELFSTSEL